MTRHANSGRGSGYTQRVAKSSGDRSARSGLSRQLVISELLDKATELFARQGYESTSLLDIARELGISRPALYHYVSSKDDLLAMLVEQVSHGLGLLLDDLSARDDLSPTEKFRSVVGLMVRQRAEHPAQFRILDQAEAVLPEPVGTKHLEAKRKVLRGFTNVIEAGIAAKEFRPVDARTAALSVLGMCNWVAWWFSRGSDVDAVVATVTDLAVGTLVMPGIGRPDQQVVATVDQVRLLLDRIAPAG